MCLCQWIPNLPLHPSCLICADTSSCILAGGVSGSEKMIELKQCLGYTMWMSTHETDGISGCQDNWTLIHLPPVPAAVVVVGVGVVGVDNPTRGTMCCVPLKLVPWVKRTRGPSDGDTLIRDSQVFYHSVRLEQISFWGAFLGEVNMCFHFFPQVLKGFFPLIGCLAQTCTPEDHVLAVNFIFVDSLQICAF